MLAPIDPLRRSWRLLVPPLMLAAVLLPAATGLEAPGPAPVAAERRAPSDGPVTIAAAGATVAAPEELAEPVRFASYADLELFLPSQRALISGFHEASYAEAVRLRPWGTPLANDNLRKDAVAPVGDGPNYAIMSTRGRSTHATSAVDVAVPVHAPISSPVDGTVVEVRPYTLYGRYADTRIVIRPADRADLLLTVLHVSDATVRPGDEVEGGRTRIAGRATKFPFRSHVDDYAGGRPPHVHIEVKGR